MEYIVKFGFTIVDCWDQLRGRLISPAKVIKVK